MHPNDSRGKDPTSSRRFKRYGRKHGWNAINDAAIWGQCEPSRRNPFPPGKRHDAFVQGQASGKEFARCFGFAPDINDL